MTYGQEILSIKAEVHLIEVCKIEGILYTSRALGVHNRHAVNIYQINELY